MSFLEKNQKILLPKRNNNNNLTSFDSKQTNITNKEISKVNKNKTVLFNGVEIIDVQNYKRYYQTGSLKLEAIENNTVNECKVCNCCFI